MRDREHIQLRDEDRVAVDDPEQVVVGSSGPRVRRREETHVETTTPQLHPPEALNLTRDRVRWGPIWAGFFTALTTMVLLGLLGLAVGLTTSAGSAAAQGAPPPGTGTAAAIWGAITALIAFFLGGWVAGRTAAVFDRGWGAWNGALVFIVAVPIILWLAGQGLGVLMGALGNYAGAMNLNPSAVTNNAQQAANQAQQTMNASGTAWGTLIGLLIGLVAAAVGGALGTRRDISLDRTTTEITSS